VNTPTVTLRLFRSTDLDTLFRIDQVCFPRGIAYGMRELRLFLQLEDSHCIVAEVSGSVAGGNAGQIACEIAGFILSQCSTQLAHVITLDVLQAHRRQSIGSQLLQTSEALAASQGARLMYLETATTNKAAIAL